MRATCLAACRVWPQCVKAVDVWEGFATPSGTARFALAGLGFSPSRTHFRRAPCRGAAAAAGGGGAAEHLTLSSLGIGTYLGAATDAEDAAVTDAVIRAVAEGLNVVDSASNYRDGRGEVSVGRALHALRLTSGVEREQLFISTKAGFIGKPKGEQSGRGGAGLGAGVPAGASGTGCGGAACQPASAPPGRRGASIRAPAPPRPPARAPPTRPPARPPVLRRHA